MKYIEIKDYCKIIKSNTILDHINLELDKGMVYGFVGRNGSGKTMLFRAICGLIKPTSGEIFINRESITKDIDYPRSCGAVIESPGFWDELTGFECLKILAGIKGIIQKKDITNWMERFELNPNDQKNIENILLE